MGSTDPVTGADRSSFAAFGIVPARMVAAAGPATSGNQAMGLRTMSTSLPAIIARVGASIAARMGARIAAAFVVTFVMLLWPPVADEAAAQSLRVQNASQPGRLPPPTLGRWSQKSVTHPGHRRVDSATPANPKGSTGMRGRRPPGNTADTRPPRGDQRPPRQPRHPRRPPVDIVVVPGALPSGSAAIVGGGQTPPPSAPATRRPGTGVPAIAERRYVPNEVVVEVATSVAPQALTAMARRHRLTPLQSFDIQLTGTRFQRLRINDRRSVPQVVRALEADGVVMAVQPNYYATLQEMAAAPALPADIVPYAPARMRMPEAHQLATGANVLIAVIDGGVDRRHPELAGIAMTVFDAIGSGDPVHPHGTSIVGAIAARARLQGTAPAAHLLVARAFGVQRTNMDGTTATILRSIDWAVQRSARVINMSFAGPRDPSIERALAAARQRGIILVAAAGNAGPSSPPLYPAALPGVIAVTATDENDRIFRAANRGNHVTIAAPGVDLWLPTINGDYRMISGTSFAAAEVSGLVALLLERNPQLSPDVVRHILMSTARDLGPAGPDPMFGAGLVDAYQAVVSIIPAAPATATSAPSTLGSGTR